MKKGAGLRVSSTHFYTFLIIILALVTLLYILVWRDAPVMTDDSPGYMEVARDLGDFSLDRLHGRVPGYPLLLLITGSAEQTSRVLFVVQLVMYMTSVILLAAFLRHLNVSIRLIWAFIFISIIPPSVVKTAYVLSGCLTEFFLVTGMLALLLWLDRRRAGFLIASGIALAVSALIRPAYQLLFLITGILFFVLAVYLARLKTALTRAAAVIFIFFLIIVGGFSLHNKIRFDYFGLTHWFGFNLSSKTARFVERLPDQYSGVRRILVKNRNRALTQRHGSHTGEMYIFSAIPELRRETGMTERELAEFMVEINWILIKRAPLNYLLEVGRSLCRYWFPATTDISNFDSGTLQFLWSLIHFLVVIVFLAVVLILAAYRIMLWALPQRAGDRLRADLSGHYLHLAAFLLPLSFIVYTMLISTVFEMGNPRYRLPTELMIFFTAVSGMKLWQRLRGELK